MHKRFTADWRKYHCRPSWCVITSRELSDVFGVSLQTINNWKMRNILPPPLPKSRLLRGQKNYYRISTIRAWAENITETQVHWNWLAEVMPNEVKTFKSLAQAEFFIKVCHSNYGIKRPLLPADFTL